MTTDLHFQSLRSDWYAANTVLPRRFVKSVREKSPLRLVGFPALWIPVCVHYGVDFDKPQKPQSYVPIFSDLPLTQIEAIATKAKRCGASRALLESVVALDPVIADFVYIVDHKLAAAGHNDPSADGANLLNTWHSFGRPEIVRLQERMCLTVVPAETFLMLPCSRHRPYGESRTHRRLSTELAQIGAAVNGAAPVVVTALGVVPEAFWRTPLVMTYDAGAVDLWRIFQLLRTFFSVNHAKVVIDCLSFRPYSEMLSTLLALRLIDSVTRPLRVRWRSFSVDLT